MSPLLNILPSQCHLFSFFSSLNIFPFQFVPFQSSTSLSLNIFLSKCPFLSIPFPLNVFPSWCLSLSISSPSNLNSLNDFQPPFFLLTSPLPNAFAQFLLTPIREGLWWSSAFLQLITYFRGCHSLWQTCVSCVKSCVVRLGQRATIYFSSFVPRFLFSLFTFLDFI